MKMEALSFRTFFIVLLLPQFMPYVISLHDDWFSYTTFSDTLHEWENAYEYTCKYNIDTFREPRETSQRDSLRSRRELHSPIRFRSKDCLKSPENLTLHIYNNPGIRKAHSVSYGFQRNKECLHGQDSDCVVYPELGRIRALVVNADRFASEKQNLNFIKDNFLIEKQEPFTTILNGGSTFERKFYEAVFLGGYCNDPRRTSHQIDGKTYPLEIYMYFLDETVPSVTLSTILVVQVEESDRDNPSVKPIINAVQGGLYDNERRFLERTKALIRRERLFHNLLSSTFYDVYDKQGKGKKGETIIQESLAPSVRHEALFTKYVEPFEKMQAIEAEVFFINEDIQRSEEKYLSSLKLTEEFSEQVGNTFFPYNFTEYKILLLVSALRTFLAHPSLTGKTCNESTQFMIQGMYIVGIYREKYRNYTLKYLSSMEPDHMAAYLDLATNVCEFFIDFQKLYVVNTNDSLMASFSLEQKYNFIQLWQENGKKREALNMLIHKHVHESPQWHNLSSDSSDIERPDYKTPGQEFKVIDGMIELGIVRNKREANQRVFQGLRHNLKTIVDRLDYKDEKEMEAIFKYLKYGNKEQDLKYTRQKVHDSYVRGFLPQQEKMRTLVELGGMEVTSEAMKEIEETDPVRSTITDAFQISWLIPADGGYYYYQGSSPVPPCFRAQNVIVFKKPITMSRYQIETLTRVPTAFERSQDVTCTTPHVSDTKFEVVLTGVDTVKARIEEVVVPVYNQRRNHLFLGHDGVHKNAVEEWAKSRKEKAEGGTGIPRERGLGQSVMLSVSLVLIFF